MKREKTVSGKLLLITESQPSLFVRGSSRLRTPVSITNAGEGSKPVSRWASMPNLPLLLSSHNSLRNFFSPSRGEIKMFRLTKLKILKNFLFKSNFLNLKRLCLLASSPPSFFLLMNCLVNNSLGGGQSLNYY